MDREPPWAPPDPVGEALHFLRMSGTYYTRSELGAPWGLAMPPIPGTLWFHVVTAGGARLEAGDEVVELGPGDLALVPHGVGHVLRDAPGSLAPPVEQIAPALSDGAYSVLRHGGDGARTEMLCGALRFSHPAARGVVDLLPPVLHVTASPLTDRMHDVLRLIAAEVEVLRPGGEAVITRLADVLVVQALRAWLADAGPGCSGWLGALHDPWIGRALALVHRDPARDWTVASLAAELPMSRSAFAARFTELVGEPAMQYVTRWRMHVALERLRAGDVTVAEVAGGLGYRSEAAFSRAFSRVVGRSPGSVARERNPVP